MGVNLKNAEGYMDKTAYDAIKNIENKKNKNMIFICSPYAGDVEDNITNAKRYARYATFIGSIPFVPHLMFTQFLNDDDPEEREIGIEMGLTILSKCKEIWCFGGEISKGMAVEIKKAKQIGIPTRYFNSQCVETRDISVTKMKECFAYTKGKCNIFISSTCEGDGCRFYKTEAQFKEDKKKSIKRIKSLDKHTRNAIIDIYFKGKRNKFYKED